MNRKKGVILSYALMVLEVLSTLFLTPFIIKAIGQSEYGVFKLSASIAAYLALLDLGLGNSVIKFISQFKEEHNLEKQQQFFGVSLVYFLSISVIALLIGFGLVALFPYIFAIGLSDEEIVIGQSLLAITTVSAAVTLATTAFADILIGYSLFSVSKVASIIQLILRVALTYAFLRMGFKSVAICLVNLGATILCRSFYVFYVLFRLRLRPTLKGVQNAFLKQIFSYSTWILLQMVATEINAVTDQVLLGILIPGASLLIAVYGVGSQISQYFQSIGVAMSDVLFPGVVKMVSGGADDSALQREMIRVGRISLIVLLPIYFGFIAFGQEFITLWVGGDYLQGYYVALMLLTAYLFILSQSIGNQILWAKNEHKELSIIQITVVLCNIVLTIFLIKWDPIIGATLGTLISLFLGDIVSVNLLLSKKLHMNLFKYYLGMFKGLLFSALVAFGSAYVIKCADFAGWGGLIIDIILFLLVYVLCLLCFGLNEYERRYMTSLLPIRKS
jgi:O-antigen/teichoic acid export membrane protein